MYKKLPPVLKRQLGSSRLNIQRVDVEGDGYCGYHCIALLEKVIYGNSIEISQIENLRNKIIVPTSKTEE